ncbi:MAG: hypothetical protein ONB37_13425 [candidate division KSB1 bacterium]|nr:hypothetical protein [candidate division KSB1 bacterium]
MPIYKYKTFEEAEQALWNFNPDEKYLQRVEELWEFANQLNPIVYPRGIFKFKTIEEANRHREAIEIEHVKKVAVRRMGYARSEE